MRIKRKYYFVSYAYSKGFGNRTLFINDDVFLINEVSEFIKENLIPESDVVILYYKELSKEEYEAQTKGGNK
ncbi:hypothetical protein [Bacteroides sp.]|uniref:hypothetical protein n=1 Tax=Bacteroides sp. TaxID=29523 RepID=UPI002634362A|nr:hypothetical protein [Bacteroides sp.]MDD3038846.1 hypothetical protein [Bacteroides sp.]